MQRLAGGCRLSWLHLNAHCANRHRLEGRQPHRHTPQRQRALFGVKAAEAGSSTDVAASSSRTALGEDSAAFDSRQQSTQSWILFTGLLLGVLGLIYVVRSRAQHCTIWPLLLARAKPHVHLLVLQLHVLPAAAHAVLPNTCMDHIAWLSQRQQAEACWLASIWPSSLSSSSCFGGS